MRTCFLLLSLLLVNCTTIAQTEVAADYQDFQKFQVSEAQAEIIYENVKKVSNETQISFALIENGKVKYYGIQRKNDSIISIENRKNVFEIGSISKVFTASILATLVLEKKIASLHENIEPYLGFNFKDGQKLSFQDLANHTSGLPRLPSNLILDFKNRNNPYAEYGTLKLKTYLTDLMELTKERPVSYSNLGVGVLGYTLAKIENTSYSELLEDKITSKYVMPNTTTNKLEVASLLVKGRNGGTVVPNWDLAALVGAGGIVSNVEDLSKFAIAQYDTANAPFALTQVKTAKVDKETAVGLGWFLLKSKSATSLLFHNGGTGGYTSSMLVDVASKNGVIILSNISALEPKMMVIDKMAKALMATLAVE